jgi:hypothetical protein
MPWNLITGIGSWLAVWASLGIPTVVGLLILNLTGMIIGIVVGGIILYLASDKINTYVKSGYTKPSSG